MTSGLCAAQDSTKSPARQDFSPKGWKCAECAKLKSFPLKVAKMRSDHPKTIKIPLGLLGFGARGRQGPQKAQNAPDIQISSKIHKISWMAILSSISQFWQSGHGLFRSCVVKRDTSEMRFPRKFLKILGKFC